MAPALKFPFQISDRSVPETSGRAAVIGQQIEQLLFTLPGERVGRPSFGCGVQRLVFGGADPETAAAAEYVISTSIRKHMSELIELDAVRVSVDEVTLFVDVLYTVTDSGEERAASFTRPLEGTP